MSVRMTEVSVTTSAQFSSQYSLLLSSSDSVHHHTVNMQRGKKELNAWFEASNTDYKSAT